jgi:hypothetical protein
LDKYPALVRYMYYSGGCCYVFVHKALSWRSRRHSSGLTTYIRVYCVNTNAGLETYPYSPRLVRVNTTILSALGDDVGFELRHLPAEEPATLPPSSRARCRCRHHSRRCCCLQGVQHWRLQLHTPASSPPARPAPGRRLVRAEHPAPGQGLMPTPVPACLPSPARFSLPTPSPTPPRPGLKRVLVGARVYQTRAQ